MVRNIKMGKEALPPFLEAEGSSQCRHHWFIESPDGPTSRGRCRRCGETRSFRNSFISEWEAGGSEEKFLLGEDRLTVGRHLWRYGWDD